MKRAVFCRVLISFLCILILLFGLYGALLLRYPNKFNDEINSAANEFDVERELIKAVIWTESKFDKNAVSKAGAVGLMQLMPETAYWCSEMLNEKKPQESELFEVETSIRLGTYFLSYLLKRFDERDAIAAYNAGQGNVYKWLSEGLEEYPFKETRDYVDRVMLARKIYRWRG